MVLAPAQRCIVAGALALIACQPGALTTPPVVPLPATATGFPVFLLPEPAIGKIEDNEARPLAITFQHDVRDTLEEAGFKLVATQEAAAGVVVRISVEKVTSIHADVFIHGAQACGVRIDVQRAGTTLASAEPEVPCLSTSAYYGMLPKDAAVALVNHLVAIPSFVAAMTAAPHAPVTPDAAAPPVPAPVATPPASAAPPQPLQF